MPPTRDRVNIMAIDVKLAVDTGLPALPPAERLSAPDGAAAKVATRPVAVSSLPTTALPPSQAESPAAPNADDLRRVAESLQRRVQPIASELSFAVDQSTGRTVIKVTDTTTDEVILQIPSELALRIGQEIDKYQHGLLVDRDA